jgi:voltage-gated potassium channel
MPESDYVRRSLLNALVLIAIIYIIAVPFYMHFENLSLINAIYLTSISITTVGYGDVVPQSDIGKIFTIFLIFSGVSIVFYHITHLGQLREKTVDKQVLDRLAIFRNITSLRGNSYMEKHKPGILDSLKSKIGEV